MEVKRLVKGNIVIYRNTLSETYDEDPDLRLRSAAEYDAWLAVLRDLLPPAPGSVLCGAYDELWWSAQNRYRLLAGHRRIQSDSRRTRADEGRG
jgi:hypothetical protein